MTIYTVQQGDTIDSIALSFGTTPDSIAYINQIPYPYALAIGQSLLLSDRASWFRPSIGSGGYAYPFISPWTLEETLPFLSGLYIFSYGFTPEGELVPPALDDTFLISAAKNAGTAPILTLTPFGPDGQFNNYLITRVVNDDAARQTLIQNITVQVRERGFEGVDIDFEYILAQDRVPFAAFVREVRTAVNALGYPVSVALAPKTSDDQPGLLYGGKDYALLGEAADFVLLMTYEWGYTYSVPMSVAPIDKVRQVADYALTRIPAAKINLGIPNYGYDWTLPYIKGTTRARTIGNVEAVQLAIIHGAAIQFDETAKTPWFRYQENQREHEVWFEDVRSMQAKFELVREYGLHGIGCWQIMRLFRAMWVLLSELFP